MKEICEAIGEIGIIPVVALRDSIDAEPLGEALTEGGLPCAEVTFRTEAAEEAIKILRNKFPDMLIGAGTVLTISQVDKAISAGAKFIVSPGLNPKVVKYCVDKHIPIFPGCANPSDIEQAMEFGLEVVKFFPAEPLGGIKMIKALEAPYAGIKFIPTGGINIDNVKIYLSDNRILACGGSWMVKEEIIRARDFDKIRQQTKEAAEIVKKIRG